MRILHLISQHPESTGSGYYLRNVIARAAAHGHTNGLVAGLSGTMEVELEHVVPEHCHFVRFEAGGPDFTIPGMSNVMPYPSSRFCDLTNEQLDTYEDAFAKVLSLAVASFAPDLIHSHHLWLATSVAFRKFPKIPLVTSCHSTDLRQIIQCTHLHERVLEPCRSLDHILALSIAQKEHIRQLIKLTDEKIAVIGAGFDPEIFRMKDKESAPPVKLLYAGKLSFAKGVDRLLEVFTTMDTTNLHLHLAGSGSGKEKERCLELAAKLPHKITVHGAIDQSRLAELMGRCHIFILPSWYEGLPLVLLEAISCGCRVITTELSGCMELLGQADSDHVRFLPLPSMKNVDTPEKTELPIFDSRLEDAILEMAGRVQRKSTPDREAVQKLVTPYSLEGFFLKIEEIYERIVGEKPLQK
ncbi:glycosyltransferase family 4 protein [Desulfogranum marinum]|uniref:glycosyltransferase family 4 protein n=1 Tax=Desulfogranum marinum TaxID=453220 RepID=UPI0029C83977|nr:glycosyltransferase family 4 protein [Desulfogranum marinum]